MPELPRQMSGQVLIGDFGDHWAWLAVLARWHFDQWGPLLGANSFDSYVTLLATAAQLSAP